MAKIKGVRQVRAAIRRAPAEIQDEVLKEVRRSTKEMHSDAMLLLNTAAQFAPLYHGQLGMLSISGAARRNYRWSVSRVQLKGRVGLLSSTAARNAFYLRFFNDGTSNQPARPFHDRAFEMNEEPYIKNQTAALDRALTKIFGR